MLLGIDIGTSSAKAVVIDEVDGRIVSSGDSEYSPSQPRNGWSEQDPEVWWRGCVEAVKTAIGAPGIAGADIKAVGVTGQMHGSVLLGADARDSGGAAEALRPALLWNDQRTAKECGDIERLAGGRRRLVEWVGNAALTGFTLPKLMWVRGHEGHLWNQVKVVLMPKDFVRFRMTGDLVTDVGDASGTLLFNPDRRAWCERATAAFGIDPKLLPRAMESFRIAGVMTATAAKTLGLAAGTPVAAGSGDNMCGAIGAGAVTPGIVAATLGTSGVIYAHSDRPRKDAADPEHCGRLHTMCAATGADGWCITGCMLSAGLSLRWARETLAPGVSYDQLMTQAAAVPAGCEGLVFLPYLTGERCPHPDPGARGGFIGLTVRHTRSHLIRAVVEGVTFGMGQILELVRSIGVPVGAIRLSGGGNRSALWRQMQADVYNCRVESTNTEVGGGAFGAAVLAGVGVGVWESVENACAKVVKVTETVEPADSTKYDPVRAVYARMYESLRERFAELGGLR